MTARHQKTVKPVVGSNTQERIKQAARVVFYKKGFAATRTREIAEEANINVALLNYYFRSKEKLFCLIMVETLTVFYQTMNEVFNHEATSLETKIQIIAENYIDLLISEPQVPVFIISELRNHNTEILEKIPAAKTILESVFVRQYNEAVRNKIIIETNPVHFLMNLMGLIVFPFINNLAIKKIAKIDDRQFNKLMEERREKIPVWIKAMFAVT